MKFNIYLSILIDIYLHYIESIFTLLCHYTVMLHILIITIIIITLLRNNWPPSTDHHWLINYPVYLFIDWDIPGHRYQNCIYWDVYGDFVCLCRYADMRTHCTRTLRISLVWLLLNNTSPDCLFSPYSSGNMDCITHYIYSDYILDLQTVFLYKYSQSKNIILIDYN